MVLTQNKKTNSKSCEDLKDFVSNCNSILVAAASDLASFSQNNVNLEASYIVALSQKAESLENIDPALDMPKISLLSRELLLGLGKICHMAQELDQLSINHQVYTQFRSKFDHWWLLWASS